MEESIYKDVVVIGNGPSAISLSYMLSGNWPYYNGLIHPNEYLQYRLEEDKGKSIFQQDLSYLAQGLEGRSLNPISVLFDSLVHPDADLGIEYPSVISWENCLEKSIEHVVIGKGVPGGSWRKMDTSSLTISLGSWMELPNFSIRTWDTNRTRCFSAQSGLKQKRATIGTVAEYYLAYVQSQKLTSNFINEAVVTAVSPVNQGTLLNNIGVQNLWKVEGHLENTMQEFSNKSKTFSYISPSVVLATGNSDQPNKLNIKGEDLPFVLYSLSALERVVTEELHNPKSAKILIVGAGLSAADAVIATHFFGIPTLHVFRRSVCDPDLIFNKLPPDIYPEYHKVHRMMQNSYQGYYDGYKAFPNSKIQEIKGDGTVVIVSCENEKVVSYVTVSYILILIGQHPDLTFLPHKGFKLGIHPEKNIDCKKNPIDIQLHNHESVLYPGIYAVGPIVGDNFVRFAQGGCLAVASHIIKNSKHLQL